MDVGIHTGLRRKVQERGEGEREREIERERERERESERERERPIICRYMYGYKGFYRGYRWGIAPPKNGESTAKNEYAGNLALDNGL